MLAIVALKRALCGISEFWKVPNVTITEHNHISFPNVHVYVLRDDCLAKRGIGGAYSNSDPPFKAHDFKGVKVK